MSKLSEWENTVQCMDCLEGMKQLPDGCVDLVFADPPFNLGKDYGSGPQGDERKDYFKWSDQWIQEGFRILKSTGSFYLMNIDKNIGHLQCIMDCYGFFVNLIIWKNVRSWSGPRSYYPKYQPILFYGKTEDYYFDTYAQKEKPFSRWAKITYEMKGQMGDMWLDIPFVYAGSIAHPEAILSPGARGKLHPTQMPTDLAKRILVFSTKEGAVAVDLFAGVGAFEESCKDLGRKFVGFDTNLDYVDICNQRLAQEVMKL